MPVTQQPGSFGNPFPPFLGCLRSFADPPREGFPIPFHPISFVNIRVIRGLEIPEEA